jgi:hypothetical protein
MPGREVVRAAHKEVGGGRPACEAECQRPDLDRVEATGRPESEELIEEALEAPEGRGDRDQ